MTITERRRLGNIGESAACEYLRRHGHEIVERNYLRKWGEIDVVSRKGEVVHFVEVKSVSRKTSSWPDLNRADKGTRATSKGEYRPEENVHPQKLRRLGRAIQTYILERRLDETDWQLDIATVLIDTDARQARVELIENIVI